MLIKKQFALGSWINLLEKKEFLMLKNTTEKKGHEKIFQEELQDNNAWLDG